jgi:hypothetical protein
VRVAGCIYVCSIKVSEVIGRVLQRFRGDV